MATLTYRHFGNPGRIYLRALYYSTKGNLIRAFFLLFLVQNHARARECQTRRTHAAAAGGRAVAAAIFFTLYIFL